jgi:hypothetical protein
MKLAEALAHRNDCQARFEELRKRIVRNICVQEGTQPGEDPQMLLDGGRSIGAAADGAGADHPSHQRTHPL